MKVIQSPWFSLLATAALLALGFGLQDQRGMLFGLAAFAAFWGVIDGISGAHRG
jgi:hypothetical protein